MTKICINFTSILTKKFTKKIAKNLTKKFHKMLTKLYTDFTETLHKLCIKLTKNPQKNSTK